MRVAAGLGLRALGATWPNPPVGCVLVDRRGQLISQGMTQPGGRPHAEAAALAAARGQPGGGDRLIGATAYVTLEPCAHYGKTPPCADALAAAGVARVVAALGDPDARVAGKGFETLRAAGIAVDIGRGADAARRSLEGYLTRIRSGRPAVTLKLAATLDGRIAMASGESRWITGGPARERVHLERARADAVLVGAGSARDDDPELTVRLPGLERRRPVRIVADPRLTLSPKSRLIATAATHPVWLLHGPKAPDAARATLAAAGARLLETTVAGGGRGAEGGAEGGLDLAAALAVLGREGVTSVFCEGGGRLAAGLLAASLADRLVWVLAGAALGAEGRPAVGTLPLRWLAEAPRFEMVDFRRCGADLWTEWRPRRDNDPGANTASA